MEPLSLVWIKKGSTHARCTFFALTSSLKKYANYTCFGKAKACKKQKIQKNSIWETKHTSQIRGLYFNATWSSNNMHH